MYEYCITFAFIFTWAAWDEAYKIAVNDNILIESSIALSTPNHTDIGESNNMEISNQIGGTWPELGNSFLYYHQMFWAWTRKAYHPAYLFSNKDTPQKYQNNPHIMRAFLETVWRCYTVTLTLCVSHTIIRYESVQQLEQDFHLSRYSLNTDN